MADKAQLIKEEIESYKESMKGLEPHSDFRRGQITAYNQIMQFIDSLQEEHNEDLEEVADKYAQQNSELLGFDCDCEPIQTGPELKKAVEFGAEWQEKKMLGIAEAFYEQGRFEQKQEMMKDAVEGTVCHRNGNVGDIYFQSDSVLSAKYPFKYGERIKIIIVKTEQQ